MKDFEPNNRDEILDWLIFEAGPEGAEMLTRARADMQRSGRPLRSLLSKSIGLNRSLTIAQMAMDYSRALLKTVDPCDWIYYERAVPELKIAKVSAMEATENYKYIKNAKKLQSLVRKPVEGKAAIKNAIMKMLEIAVEIEGECGPADFQVGAALMVWSESILASNHWMRFIKHSSSPSIQYNAEANLVLALADSMQFSKSLASATLRDASFNAQCGAAIALNQLDVSIRLGRQRLIEHSIRKVREYALGLPILSTGQTDRIMEQINNTRKSKLPQKTVKLVSDCMIELQGIRNV